MRTILGWLIYDFSQQNFSRETEAAINAEFANILAATANLEQTERMIAIAHKSSEQSHPLYLYQDIHGNKLAGNLDEAPIDATLIAEGLIRFKSDREHLAAKIHTFADGNRLLIARNIEKIIASHERLKWLSVLMFLFMLTVICVSFLTSYFVVSRINRIGDTARKIIETGDLSRRVQIDSSWDDLSNLGEALNVLLERIDELMKGIRDVADNIAHDLRTPLTRLRNQIEALRENSTEKMEIDNLLAETDGLLNTFSALLRIANIEKGKRHQNFETLALQPLLNDVVELYEPVAEDKEITLNVTLNAKYQFQGDRDLLFQLFANLLDNAIKFSPKNSAIEIALSVKRKQAQVIIADSGIGINKDELDKVFNRFYRSERSRHETGSGLGLSLVKAVLDLHKATITLEDNQPGLRVIIRL